MFLSDTETKKDLICAIYTRLSHQEKGEISEHDSISGQKEHCRKYIELKKEKGWKIYPQSYDDRNQSGGKLNRPALKRLLYDAKQGKFNMIVVTNIDRLTRSLKDFYELWHILEEYEIELLSTKQDFNTTTSIGRLHLDIVLRFAQFERELASERTQDSMGRRAAEGLFHGGHIPLGYELHPTEKGNLKIVPKEAKLVRYIFEKYIEMRSANRLAKHLNKKGYRTKTWLTKDRKKKGGNKFTEGIVLNLLKNPVYTAKTEAKRGKTERQAYPARWKLIISENTFNRVQRIIKSNAQTKGSISENKYNLLLTGLICCDSCKSQMTANYSLKKGIPYLYYKCTKVDHSDKDACKIKSVPARELEQLIINRIKFISTHKNLIDSFVKTAMHKSKNRLPVLQEEKTEIMGRLAKIKSLAEPIIESIGQKKFSLIEDKLKRLEEEKTILSSRLAELNNEIDSEKLKVLNPDLIMQNLRLFRDIFDQLPFEKQRDLLHLIIKEIIYNENPEKIKIALYDIPEIKPPDLPKKGKSGSSISRFDERTNWLPEQDTSRTTQPQYCQLLMRLYKRRRRRLEISIDEPFPEQRPSSIYIPKNAAKEAVRVRDYLINNPDTNQSQIAEEFGVTRARISQLIKINNNLPNNFITILAESKDPILLRRFSGKRLLKIASLQSETTRLETIELLMPKHQTL